MAYSESDSRQRTIIIVLVVVIVIALLGIGLLLAKLLVGGDDTAGGITVAAPTPETETAASGQSAASGPEPAITAIEAPSLELQDQSLPPASVSSQPVPVATAVSVGPIAPVMLVSQPLLGGHLYRVEITTEDGSAVEIEGNWSQAATSASGQAAAPQIEFFEGNTPYKVDIVPPVADPDQWSVSVSAGQKGADILKSPKLVIVVWDVTGGE